MYFQLDINFITMEPRIILLLNYKKYKRKMCNWVICRDVDGSRDCHTEWSKSEREKQISYINAYMWNLENGTDEPVCRAEIETQM